MNIEYVSGEEKHTSNWSKFYVKGLEKWEVKEDFPENIEDKHHSYQGYVCLNVPEGRIFTLFEESGNKLKAQVFKFYLCQTSTAEALNVAASAGRGRCQGNFKIICAGEGKTKATRLMNWWNTSKHRNLEFALHCAAHIDKRGIKQLPPLPPKTEGDVSPKTENEGEESATTTEPETEKEAITSSVEPETVNGLQSEQSGTAEAPQLPHKQWLHLGLITIDAGTQSRKTIHPPTIDDYAEQMADGLWQWEREPLPIVYSDRENFWPGDGHHRIIAANKAGIEQIFVEIRPGTLRDAIFYSTSANKYHGLPRTNADKRNQVELLLSDPEWQQMSDRAIADHCGVSAPFVGKIKAELAASGTVNISTERIDKSGRRINTTNIGTKPKKAKSAPTSQPEQELAPPADTGSVQLLEPPTTAALIGEAMPGIKPELLKPSFPEVERAIATGIASPEQTQPQTPIHPAEEDLKAAAEAQITALSHKLGAKTITEIALELCSLEEIREIHADLSLNLEALDEEE